MQEFQSFLTILSAQHRQAKLTALSCVISFATVTPIYAQAAPSAPEPKNQSKGAATAPLSSPAQQPAAGAAAQKTAPAAPPPATSAAKTPTASGTAQGQIPPAEGDYIPCKFSPTEIKTLISPEVAPTLTAADEDILKQQVFAAAISQNGDPLLRGAVLNTFLQKLANDPLTGLTPSQALNRVINDLSQSQSVALAPVTDTDITMLGIEMKKSAPTPSVDGPAIDSFIAYLLTKEAGVVGIVRDGQLQDAALKALDKWAGTSEDRLKSVADLTTAIGAAQPINNDAIIDAARDSLALLERPPDVGCAMSILTYKEADTAYGYRIANEYIAVQIIVRNLNRDKPFVVHDAEFQVNSDPTGLQLGRFFSGRDKVIVRALSAAQSSFDPRALVVHTALGVGAIMSATVPIFNVVSFTNAAAVFNGAFVPGLDKFWKDQTGDQLNLLNDTGFSASLNSQTTVPQLGTVLFVIFVPSKQFQEGWWTQPCVEKTYVGSTDATGALTLPDGSGNTGGSKNSPQTGPDVRRALETCAKNDVQIPPRSHRHWYTFGYRPDDERVGAIPTKTVLPDPNADLFRNAYPRKYKDWSGNSLQLFTALSSTVVAGTHITEDSQLQPSISGLNCSTDKLGNLEFPSPDKDTVSCPVAGKNLDKVAQLRLRNAKDSTDVTTAEGTVSVSGDSSKGTVVFQTAALHALPQPAYNVFSVSGTGVEQKTGQAIHLSTDPFVSSVSPAQVDFSKDPKAQTLTIEGDHLESVDAVVLTDKSNKAVTIPLTLDVLKKDTQLLVPLDPSKSDFSAFGTTAIPVQVTVTVNKKPVGNSVSLTFTGPPKATAAKPAPAKSTAPSKKSGKAK
jgi:hypothetical protein